MYILLNSVCFSQRFFYLDKGILKYAKSQTDVSLLPGPACYCRSVQAARVCPEPQFSVGNGFPRWHRAPSPHTLIPAALALDLGGLRSLPGEGAGQHPGYHSLLWS